MDNIRLAQFIHLLMKNKEVRQLVDTITSSAVLILGCFTEERKQVVNALRNELRNRDYSPVMLDIKNTTGGDLAETVCTLAGMARFVIADLSASVRLPQELDHIIPNLPAVPIQPVLLVSDRKHAMFERWEHCPWVLPDFLYEDEKQLLTSLIEKVIEPAEKKRLEYAGKLIG